MYDDRYERYGTYERYDRYDEQLYLSVPDSGTGYREDARLMVQVFVDGRPVDGWSTTVRGTRWEEWAQRFDLERRPEPVLPPAPPAPPTPAPVLVLRWLDALVGGRQALLDLAPEDHVSTGEPLNLGGAAAEAYEAVAAHLDRVCGALFDSEVLALAENLLTEVVRQAPEQVLRMPANEVAGGVVWLLAKANGLFVGGVTQAGVKRELWLRRQLNTCGQRLEGLVRGVTLYDERRPPQAPDLRPLGNPALLTTATRARLIRWRDEALAASDREMVSTDADP